MLKPIFCGLDYVCKEGGQPRLWTRKGAQHWADREARKLIPSGFWYGVVSDCYSYWRVSFGGDPEVIRG